MGILFYFVQNLFQDFWQEKYIYIAPHHSSKLHMTFIQALF
jgi:hypothetical protein